GEVVGGIVVMEQEQNVLAVTRGIEQKLQAVRASLPDGIGIVTTYDRSTWIWATLKQFLATLLSELIVLILVTVLFLGRFRSSIATRRPPACRRASLAGSSHTDRSLGPPSSRSSCSQVAERCGSPEPTFGPRSSSSRSSCWRSSSSGC